MLQQHWGNNDSMSVSHLMEREVLCARLVRMESTLLVTAWMVWALPSLGKAHGGMCRKCPD